MKEDIGYIYILSRESEKTIRAVKEQQSNKDLRRELEKKLKDFAGHFYASVRSDENGARDDFRRVWEEMKASPVWEGVTADFESCVVLEEVPALRRPIPGSADFVFYLKNIDDVEALLRSGLRDAEGPREGGAGWSVEAQLPAQLVGQQTVDFKAKVSAAEPRGTAGQFSFDQEIWLWDEEQEQERIAKGRILACLCERGDSWSVSFRRTERKTKNRHRLAAEPCYLNDPATIRGILYDLIFRVESSEQHGLVVIAGRTGSCKSEIARGLVESHLKDRPDKHLVTYEDPIEKKINTKGPNTSREKGKDVSDLREATHNALRQKPAVLFVGETRDPEEWKMLLHYAGTGHLVVTTAHAGSLIEAVGNILQATQANDPTSRSVVGERLLAVVHLKSETAGGNVGILIPALWRRTSEGIKALMAEGLSSLVPNTPPKLSDGGGRPEPLPSSIGRYWFARELLKQEEAKGKLNDDVEVENSALEWDLEGV